MSKDENKESTKPEILDPRNMPVSELIEKCGALRYSLTQIAALLRLSQSTDEVNRVIIAMKTPGSAEYNAYESGLVSADFKLQTQLLEGAGADKDMYDAFNAEQRRHQINAALADKFGLGREDY